jgi:hypothetical protein
MAPCAGPPPHPVVQLPFHQRALQLPKRRVRLGPVAPGSDPVARAAGVKRKTTAYFVATTYTLPHSRLGFAIFGSKGQGSTRVKPASVNSWASFSKS